MGGCVNNMNIKSLINERTTKDIYYKTNSERMDETKEVEKMLSHR